MSPKSCSTWSLLWNQFSLPLDDLVCFLILQTKSRPLPVSACWPGDWTVAGGRQAALSWARPVWLQLTEPGTEASSCLFWPAQLTLAPTPERSFKSCLLRGRQRKPEAGPGWGRGASGHRAELAGWGRPRAPRWVLRLSSAPAVSSRPCWAGRP